METVFEANRALEAHLVHGYLSLLSAHDFTLPSCTAA